MLFNYRPQHTSFIDSINDSKSFFFFANNETTFTECITKICSLLNFQKLSDSLFNLDINNIYSHFNPQFNSLELQLFDMNDCPIGVLTAFLLTGSLSCDSLNTAISDTILCLEEILFPYHFD